MNARIAFIGTEEFSSHMLAEIVRLGGNVVAAWSIAREHAQNIPEWRDVGDVARAKGIEHHEVKSMRAEGVAARAREVAPDVLFVCGMPRLLPPELLAAARLGAIDSHQSLLPKNRGPRPVPWHFLNGDAEGGLTFFLIGKGVDDGPVISRRRFRISLTDTSRTIYDRTISAGREMLPALLAMVEHGHVDATPQDESQATRVPGRLPDGRIDWLQNARRIYDLVRALTDPYGGAYCWLGTRRLGVWEAGYSHEPIVARPGEVVKMTDRGVEVATGAGLVVLRRVQLAGDVERAFDVFSREGIKTGKVLP